MSFDAAVLARLRKRIADERQNSTDVVVTGRCEDLRQYGYSCGYVKALDDVITFIEEITSDIQKG